MAREFNQDYNKATLNRPIPGESLYDDPDSPSAYEGPTKFTTIQKASQYLFDQLTEEDKLKVRQQIGEVGSNIMENRSLTKDKIRNTLEEN